MSRDKKTLPNALVRALIMSTTFVLATSCGADDKKAAVSADPLVVAKTTLETGFWMGAVVDNCGQGMVFKNGMYATMTLCIDGQIAYTQMSRGDYEIASDNELNLSRRRHSCPEIDEVEADFEFKYTLGAKTLTLVGTGVLLVLTHEPNTEPEQAYTYHYGCFTDEGFIPNEDFNPAEE